MVKGTNKGGFTIKIGVVIPTGEGLIKAVTMVDWLALA